MATDPGVEGEPTTVAAAYDLMAVRLADDIVLVTYLTEDSDRRCNRSSISRRTRGAWQLFFHQGTIIPAS